MYKIALAFFVSNLFFLSACSEQTVIVADTGQIGAHATIIQNGNTAALHVPPSPSWPKGWDTKLTVTEGGGIIPGIQQMLTFKTSNNISISFINIGNKYVCQSCVSLNLPLDWHRETK